MFALTATAYRFLPGNCCIARIGIIDETFISRLWLCACGLSYRGVNNRRIAQRCRAAASHGGIHIRDVMADKSVIAQTASTTACSRRGGGAARSGIARAPYRAASPRGRWLGFIYCRAYLASTRCAHHRTAT